MQYVCVDIGGTAIKYAMITDEGFVLTQKQIPTRISEEGMGILPIKIANIAYELQSEYDKAEGIAVCSPGLIDSINGEVIFAGPTFPGYSGMKLCEQIEELTHLPCSVENDVNAAGLGESWLGAGKDAKNVFCMFIGTGIGGALVIDGHLVRGASFAAGEIGFMRFSGKHFEKLASMSALLKHTNLSSGEEVFRSMNDGDINTFKALDMMSQNIAAGLAEICCIVNPESIILGGAVMVAQSSFFTPRISNYLKQLLPPEFLTNTHLKIAQLGNNAGCIGALKHFLQLHG